MRIDLRYVFALLGTFAVYVAAGKLGLAFATVHESATAVWPPTGIAIAACLVLGRRVWPAIAAGALVVNVTTSGDVPSSLGIAAGNTLEAVVAASLTLRLANGRYAFVHPAAVLRYGAIALAATTISASIGVSTLGLAGLARWDDAGLIWLTWWLGDVGGALVIAPALVLWATRAPELRHAGSTLELAALGLTVAVLGVLTFTPVSPLARANYAVQFVVFPVLIWPVVRFGPRVAATVALALSAIAVWGAVQHAGPWGGAPPNAILPLVQGFMVVATLTALVVAAAVIERQRALEALHATEERLRRTEERKVAARDELLSIAAHELKTPLTSLNLATQYLVRTLGAERPLNEDAVRTSAAALVSQTQRLGRLVDQLLDTVRAQENRMDLAIADEDVVALASRVASEVQSTTTRHEIEVHGPPVYVTALDPVRIEQVLRNLLDNATKYSPAGKVAVEVLPEDGTGVRLVVRDHGPGIPVDARAHIFDRFYRAQGNGDRPDGLGLGLHVSRHIVELHGGSIAADFPDDGGTRIIVRLPTKVGG